MKKKLTFESGIFISRVLFGFLLCSFGIVLALFASGIGPTPSSINQAQLTKSLSIATKGITVKFPEGWSTGQPTQNSWVILNVPADQQNIATPSIQIVIGYLERTDHADAVNQLAEYAHESHNPSTFLAIGGWPALQRVQLVERPQPGEGPKVPDPNMVQITIAVAADNLLVRLEADLPSNADQQLKDTVIAIGRSLVFGSVGDPAQVQQELNKLGNSPNRPDSPSGGTASPNRASTGSSIANTAGTGSPIFASTQLNNLGTNGELEVGVSNNGTNIVVVKQGSFVSSNDGGNTFSSSGGFGFGDGDSSVAFGQSGTFYVAGLFGGNCPANSTCIETTSSTDNGQTFPTTNIVNGVVCPNSGGGACSVDQEHIAADRVNAGTAGDRVYIAVRNCQGGCGNATLVTCSPDSGATWAPVFALETGADFPRVTVGGDGSFYVVYHNGGNIRIDKFNSCTTSASQMTRASGSFPTTVSAFSTIPDCGSGSPPGNPGFPGLDRCNNGNILSSPTATVDDTNANHVYVAWANNTLNNNNTILNNENVMVADSTDGGATWRTPVTINTSLTARRFMPWVCATGGNAFVTWYDRRNATAANNDFTDYFAASAGLNSGNLVANNDEFQISTASDPQCNLWPTGPRSPLDAENCSVQPQLAGNCCTVALVGGSCPAGMGSGDRCDFSSTVCPSGESCQTDGFNTNPKYGDYNGNACTLGRLYTVFASGTSPSGTGLTKVRAFSQSFVVASTPTALTYTGDTTGAYLDPVTLSATLTLSGTSAGVSSQPITFTLGTQSCMGTTDPSGVASCSITLNQLPGSYTVTASFAGSGNYQASSDTEAFTISKARTTTTYTGVTSQTFNNSVALSATLLLTGPSTPFAGQTITFTLGTQGCTATTNASGVASCSITLNQLPGSYTVTASFAGSSSYLPSSDSKPFTINFTGPAPSSGSTCNGAYNGTFNGNITVSTGQDCVLDGGKVTGNITQNGGNLELIGEQVGGNVQVNNGGTVTIATGTNINGNLQIQNLRASAGQNMVCGASVKGDVLYQKSATGGVIGAGTAACAGNTIGGNLQITNNTAPMQASGNSVNGNLQASNNTSTTQITNNAIMKNLQCDGNAAIIGSGNTAKQKQGQCATF